MIVSQFLMNPIIIRCKKLTGFVQTLSPDIAQAISGITLSCHGKNFLVRYPG